jgi:Flp pilus assembly protein TadD
MRLEPARVYPLLQLGRDLAKRGKVDEAIAVYRETAWMFPRDTNCHNELGIVLETVKGDFPAAAEYREVMRIKPEEPDARSNLGLMLYKGGKTAEALAVCREAVRLQPDWGNARHKYGVILYNIGQDNEAALVELQAAARLRPDAATYSILGRVLSRLKKYREAITALRKALEFVPKDSKEAKEIILWIAECERASESEDLQK